MNFITKKNFIFKLIVCVCIFLAIINVGSSHRVYAAKDEKQGIGGMLLNPICDLLLGLGDAIMDITQNSIMGTDATIRIDNTKETNWGAIILGVLAGIAYVALWIIPGTQGIAAAITSAAVKAALIYGAANIVTAGGVHATVTAISAEVLEDVVVLPTFAIGPEEIFGGRVLLFDANIFKPKNVKVDYNVLDLEGDSIIGSGTANSLQEWETLKSNAQYLAKRHYYIDDNGEEVVTSVNNSAYELREIIQKWYYIIRNIALVGSMLILLYIGIRMIVSSVAEEKAKYKQMLSDWVIALCLIVLMHYIMIFAHNTVESITRIFNNMINPGKYVASIVNPEDHLKKKVEELEDANGVQYIFDEGGLTEIRWPTNMMGKFRVQAYNKDGSEQYVGYVLAYLALVLFTLIFSFTYIKRLLYLLFLTVISPLVALTYPIDKIHDGKAQAFNMWFKEYLFNLLIQPFHLLLYAIFVTMAFDLASQNVIYSLVVIGFMIPAEKFLRTMFGFNKASTPGLFAGAAGAAFTMSAVNSLGKFAKGGHGGGNGGNGSGGKGKEQQGRLRTADSGRAHSQEQLFTDAANENPQNNHDTNPNIDQSDSDQNPQNNHDTNPNIDQSDSDQNPQDNQDIDFSDNERDSDVDISANSDINVPSNSSLPQSNTDGGESIHTNREEIDNDDDYEDDMDNEADDEDNVDDEAIEPEDNEERKPSKARRFLRATLSSAGNAAKARAISDLKAAPRTIARIGASAATATTLGAIGLASGIVSGDLNTAMKNTTAAAGVGVAVGTGVANRAFNSIEGNYDPTAKERWQREYYGKDYNKIMKEKADKEFRKDKEIRKLYKTQLGLKTKDEVDTAMMQATTYRQYGVNDNDIIIKAMKLKLENSNESRRDDKRRIAAAKLAESSKTQKDFETNMKRFSKAQGVTEGHVKEMESLVRQINNL